MREVCRWCGVPLVWPALPVDQGIWWDANRPTTAIGRALCDPIGSDNPTYPRGQQHLPISADLPADFQDVDLVGAWLDA